MKVSRAASRRRRNGVAARCVGVFFAVALATACGAEALPDAVDLEIALTSDVEDVELGAAFTLEVVRTWNHDLIVDAFETKALAPLVVETEAIARRTDGIRTEERIRYRARAFALDEVAVPALLLEGTPKTAGAVRRVQSRPLRLRVWPLLDPTTPGPPEGPAGPLESEDGGSLAARGAILVAVLFLAVGAGAFWGRRRRLRALRLAAQLRASEEVALDWGAAARAELQRAAARLTAAPGGAETGAAHAVVAGGEALRTAVAKRCGASFVASSTEEWLASVDAHADVAAGRERLGRLAALVDRVKFARRVPTPEIARTWFEDALAWVGEVEALESVRAETRS